MTRARQLGPFVAAAAIVLVILAGTRAVAAERAVAIGVVLLAAIALRELVRKLHRGEDRESAVDGALLRRAKPSAPAPAFAAMERELASSFANAEHAHRRLIPLLRTAAAARLASRHGVALDRRPDLARQLLGEQAWELIRPDAPAPATRRAGPKRETVVAAVAAIEAL